MPKVLISKPCYLLYLSYHFVSFISIQKTLPTPITKNYTVFYIMIPIFMLILSATLLKPYIVFAAPPIAQVVSTNNVLEGVANQADQDVNAVTAVNGLLKAQV